MSITNGTQSENQCHAATLYYITCHEHSMLHNNNNSINSNFNNNGNVNDSSNNEKKVAIIVTMIIART